MKRYNLLTVRMLKGKGFLDSLTLGNGFLCCACGRKMVLSVCYRLGYHFNVLNLSFKYANICAINKRLKSKAHIVNKIVRYLDSV